MTALELQSEYQSLVSRIANEDYETITKADLVIDPRIAAMTKGINSPESFDYKNEYHQEVLVSNNLFATGL